MAQVAGVALLLLLLAIRPAACHAVLTGSDPAADAVLEATPPRLVLRYNEPVRVLRLSLLGPDGGVAELPGRAADGEVAAEIAAPLARGTHVLSWRVVSADGHPVAGTLVFAVGAPGGAARAAGADPALVAALWATRGLMVAAAVLAAGAAAFAAWIGPAPAPRLTLLGLLPCLALSGLQGLDLLGLGLAEWRSAAAWRAGLESGVAVQAGLAGLAILLAQFRGRLRAGLAVLAFAGCAAAVGHAATAAPQLLMRPAMALHAGTVALWLGSLPPLLALAGGDAEVLAKALRRYGRVVAPGFVALLASGLALAAVQLGGDPNALAATNYGWILSAKLLLAALILLLAARHRLALTPRIGTPAARLALARGIRIELAAALLVLGLAMGWRFTPPPRALAAAAVPLHVHLHDLPAMADLTFEPGRAGANRVAIVLQGPGGTTLDAAQVTLRAASPERGIEAIAHQARRDAAGIWRVDRLFLPVGGPWAIEIEILVGHFEQIVLADQIDLPP